MKCFLPALLTLCATAALTAAWAGPFDAPSPLPYHAPQFDKIKDSDYAPAFALGIKQQEAEMDAIAGNAAAPTSVTRTNALPSRLPASDAMTKPTSSPPWAVLDGPCQHGVRAQLKAAWASPVRQADAIGVVQTQHPAVS